MDQTSRESKLSRFLKILNSLEYTNKKVTLIIEQGGLFL